VVSDGSLASAPDLVNVTVQPAQTTSNIAPLATVTASSQNASTGQLAVKAVDGVIDGYPGDYTREWATVSQKVGAWLKLTWTSAYVIDHVVLYDRPNTNDRITSATLSFSDGTSVTVGALNNAGSATTVTFTPRTVTSLTLTVTGVANTTSNIGLAEIQVYGAVPGSANQPPTANAGPDQTVNEGATVTLPGSGSDPDGAIASYSWSQTVGPTVTLNNANTATASFIAPAVTANTLLTFRLTVTDNAGATGTDTVNVTVNDVPVANQPPTANAGADKTVNEGAAVSLPGSGSDPDGTIASYAWAQTAGPTIILSGANTATASFAAPQVSATTVLTFRLTVTDNGGATASDTVNVTVNDVPAANQPPTANAGPDQTVNQGVLVQLNGTASSDPEGLTLTYQWAQTAGPTVVLSNATTATPSFTSPTGLTQNATLTFQLTVTDAGGAAAIDTVNVTVQPAQTTSNIAPLATVTASSQNASTGQLAVKAVDGVIDGYPGDYTREWATVSQKVGAWLKLTWTSAYVIDHVVLYDRPNTNDRITSATLSFSDGTSVTVGALNNAGSATTVTFTPRTVTSLTLTVTGVANTTSNIGLAEIQVYGAVPRGDENNLVANNACLSTPFGVPVNGTVSATSPNPGPLTYTLASDGVKVNTTTTIDTSSGAFIYTPRPGVRGMDKFTYTVTDSVGYQATGTITVLIDDAAVVAAGPGRVRIMPLGDSITAGFPGGSAATDLWVGYRRKLFKDLENASPNYGVDFVGGISTFGATAWPDTDTPVDRDHEGHDGWCDDNTPFCNPSGGQTIAANVTTWLNQNPADIILLHIGTNQFSTDASGVNTILNNINTWAQANYPVTVFLARIIKTVNDFIPDADIAQFNTNVDAIDGNRAAVKIYPVDQTNGAGLTYTLGVDMGDSVHPNQSGYDKMADKWKADITAAGVLPSCP
jgi:hypothetical protein